LPAKFIENTRQVGRCFFYGQASCFAGKFSPVYAKLIENSPGIAIFTDYLKGFSLIM